MESYLQQAPCLYFSASEDGILMEFNQTFSESLGYTIEELQGLKLEKVFTIATRIFQQTHLFPLLKMQGYAEEIFISLLTKGGEHLPVLLNAKRVGSDHQTVTLYTGIVVHNRKKFEDELVAARKAAETALNENTLLLQAKADLQRNAELLDQQVYQVSKLNEELLQFNRVVTHDLQEPLRKLFVFTNMLLESTEQVNNKTVQRIKTVSEQMRSILSGLQQYVWLTETKIHPVIIDIGNLSRFVKAEIENEFPGTTIELIIEEMPSIEADREQFHFLLHEIMYNAVRFRSHTEQVRIEFTADTLLLNQFKTISGKYKYTNYLRLQVKDNGLGFDAAYKEQVFELFKRLHAESGRGVGLSLCKKIVENHGGTISVDSAPGQGTLFSIVIPYLEPLKPVLNNQSDKKQKSTTSNENESEGDFIRG